ncbi:MAG: class I SAM-dependent methyltransferase [Actinomycetota bacterium]
MGDANYPEQAPTYDETRSANREVVRLVGGFLGEGSGRSVIDVAGGTGNYAQAIAGLGLRVAIVDREPAMLARSVPKIGAGRQILGNAERLPFAEGTVDAVMCISAMHQFDDHRAAMREARRVMRDGPYVLQVFTQENLIPAFAFEYFPGSGPPPGMHEPAGVTETWLREAGFSRVERAIFVYSDTSDATLHALHVDPAALADAELMRNTSFFQRLPAEARAVGLAALRRDLESGTLAERVREGMRLAAEQGHGTVFAAWPGSSRG